MTYDSTKADKTGENVMPKNIFGNPFNYAICWFCAMGCYLSITNSQFVAGSDLLFRFGKAKKKSAANNYCKSLKKLVQVLHRGNIVRQYCRLDHFHAHGTRKGASVLATSGTTCPPPLPSVFHRGEWSLGDVQDVYWKWAAQGDSYLGRILAGLNPDSEMFDALPVHFKEGIENKYISEAMNLCFGNILKLYSAECAIGGFLLFCLASVVHHSDKLKAVGAERPGHSFSTIPVLNDVELLTELKKLVTLDPAGDVQRASGIPPHVRQSKKLREALEQLQVINKKFDSLKEMVKEAVTESMI